MDLIQSILTRLTATDDTGPALDSVNRRLDKTADKVAQVSKETAKSRSTFARIASAARFLNPVSRALTTVTQGARDLSNAVGSDMRNSFIDAARDGTSLVGTMNNLQTSAEAAAGSIGGAFAAILNRAGEITGVNAEINRFADQLARATGTRNLDQLLRDQRTFQSRVDRGLGAETNRLVPTGLISRRSVTNQNELDTVNRELGERRRAQFEEESAQRFEQFLQIEKSLLDQRARIREEAQLKLDLIEQVKRDRQSQALAADTRALDEAAALVERDRDARIRVIDDREAASAQRQIDQANRERERAAEVAARAAEKRREEEQRAAEQAERQRLAYFEQQRQIAANAREIERQRTEELRQQEEERQRIVEESNRKLIEIEEARLQTRKDNISAIQSTIGSIGQIVNQFARPNQNSAEQFRERAQEIESERERLRQAIRDGNTREIADAKAKIDALTALDQQQDAQQRARFERYKKFQTAIALASAFAAAAQTLADVSKLDPFQKIAAYASVLATGLGAVAQIRSLNYQSQAASAGGGGAGAGGSGASGQSASSSGVDSVRDDPVDQTLTIQINGAPTGDEFVRIGDLDEQLAKGLSNLLRRNVKLRRAA